MASGMKLLLALFLVSVTVGWKRVGAQVHHVVTSGRWDSPSDVGTWSSGRTFRVGDSISFTNSASQESIVELSTQEEYISCDLTNPIRMFTDGLNKISLEEEGIRYFASGTLENCKKGLKLPVDVHKSVAATGPTPSSSINLNGLLPLLFIGLILSYIGLM